MKTSLWIKGLALVVAVVVATTGARAEPLRIFAAASLQGPLDAVAASWARDTRISYGGSGTLARQISLGAPADVVILANSAWMEWLLDQGHVAGPATDLLSNRLVVIGPSGAPPLPDPKAGDLLARLDGGRLAMGQHTSVPAGIYAQAWLDEIGAWEALRPHLAETDNVRAALVLVARCEMPLGIVYASDAVNSDAVSVLWTVPEGLHPQIRYPAAALTTAGAEFLAHMATQTAVFEAAGLTALP
ncbi:unnamed protein product [Chrysoparadoxa australica]